MAKKWVIFFFLATAYSVVLAHNFIPHQHTEVKLATHSHDHDNSHHHDHKEGNQDEENNPSDLFHHFEHLGEGIIVYTTVQYVSKIEQKRLVKENFKPFSVIINAIEKPPSLNQPVRQGYIILPQSFDYFFLLKAPPVFTA